MMEWQQFDGSTLPACLQFTRPLLMLPPAYLIGAKQNSNSGLLIQIEKNDLISLVEFPGPIY